MREAALGRGGGYRSEGCVIWFEGFRGKRVGGNGGHRRERRRRDIAADVGIDRGKIASLADVS